MARLVSSNSDARIDFRYDLFPDAQSISVVFRGPTQIQYVMAGNKSLYTINGSQLDAPQGVVTSFGHTFDYGDRFNPNVATIYSFTDFTTPAPAFLTAYEQQDPVALTRLVLAGADSLTGAGGNDYLWGLTGDDSIQGGAGNDTLGGDEGRDWVRGGPGSDFIHGGARFDDLHGNEGDDTVSGRDDDDWVVGGKDQDLLFGDGGDDIVYGNLGNDTCDGGDGADIVRGGQGNDSIAGGAGGDFIAGDLGADTLSGGAGADIFHTHATAGLDRVTDFNAAEGDRVNLLPGTSYSLSQRGADTIIDMADGNQMVLVNVALTTLPAGWIFGAG